jgi:RNA polymerase sigma factor (sigma-70 family)
MMEEDEYMRALCESRDKMFRTANRVLFDRADAEDAVQDAMVKALAARRTFDPSRGVQLSTYLCTIAKNEALQRLREGMPVDRHADVSKMEIDDEQYAERSETLIDRMRSFVERSKIAAKYPWLPGAFFAYYMGEAGDRTLLELADELGIKRATVRTIMRRTADALAREFGGEV